MARVGPDALTLFHPVARRWFQEAYGNPTHAQRDGWRAIAAGHTTLIQAPTASGKTLAAELLRVATAGEGRAGGLLIRTINGQPGAQPAVGRFLIEAGFTRSAMGYHVVRPRHER
ncbi:MAG: hypothetical protein Q7V01_08845 [Vicinamibacterales bacterium]|nr:hypothetical protein [Vicinamibacterales bacterium]